MTVSREAYRFPTRSYPYRHPDEADAAMEEVAQLALDAGQLHRLVLGIDNAPRPMTAAEIAALHDPFAELLLKRGAFPLTLRSLLSAIDAVNQDQAGLPEQRCFLAAEGGQVPWSAETANVNRLFRFAVARSKHDDVRILVSASTALDSPDQFLQLIGWDSHDGVFNYYERRGGTWIWAGNSNHALAPKTRGCGPFDSHVNGSLVMKELRAPWNSWHSMDAAILDDVLAPDDPLRAEPLFQSRESAHVLETTVVRQGIARWNEERLRRAVSSDGSRLANVDYFLRQLLQTTTANLASSAQRSRGMTPGTRLRLPDTFFFNKEALLDFIGLDPDIEPISVSGERYLASLARYEFVLTDGQFTQPGDAFFAFLVPEPAFEDTSVLDLLLRERMVSDRFFACLLMVDFVNPVYSTARERLLRYVPATARVSPGGPLRTDIEHLFVDSLEAAVAGTPSTSPEHAFLSNWRLPQEGWRSAFEQRIERYYESLRERAEDDAGFDGWVRLAESRRREFRRHPLAEFRLTIPTTNIPTDAAPLAMCPDGTVATVS